MYNPTIGVTQDMPIYDYKCNKCENVFEALVKMADAEQPTKDPCPECGKKAVVRYYIKATPLHSGEGIGSTVVPDGFKDVLKNIRKKNIHSRIDTK